MAGDWEAMPTVEPMDLSSADVQPGDDTAGSGPTERAPGLGALMDAGAVVDLTEGMATAQ